MNMAGGLIALRRGEKAAPSAFNFRWLLAHEMMIFLFQMSNVRDKFAIAAGELNSFVPEIIAPGRFAAWRGAIL